MALRKRALLPSNYKQPRPHRIEDISAAEYDRLARVRFDARHMPEPNSGCWLWVGAVDPDGYGNFEYRNTMIGAHRAAWLFYRGPIPKKAHVLHTCDVRCCVNPQHLVLGTHAQNMLHVARRDRRPRGGKGLPRGVFRQASGNFTGTVAYRGRTHCAGTYPTIEEAVAAAAELRAQLFAKEEGSNVRA